MKKMFLALVVALLAGTPVAHAKDHFTVGNWEGSAYYDDATGAFSFCSVGASYVSGDYLIFAIGTSGNLAISVSNSAWDLKIGGQTPIVISIDRYAPIHAQAQNVSATMAMATFSDVGEVFYQLQHGYQMQIDAPGGSLYYDLTGTYRALKRTLDCTMYEMGVATNNPFGSSAPASSAATQPDSNTAQSIDRSELLIFASNLLSNANITGYRILSESERQKYLPDYPVVWFGPGANAGAVAGVVLGDPSISVADAVNAVVTAALSGDASACHGDFTSGTREEKPTSGLVSRRVFVLCKDKSAEGSFAVEYDIFGTADRQLLKIAFLTYGNSTRSQTDTVESSDKLFSAAVYTIQSPAN